MKYSVFVVLAMALAASARPDFRRERRADVDLQNGQDAIAENNRFRALTTNSSCQGSENACVDDKFAQCVGGKFVLQKCAANLVCASLPNVGTPGTSIACTTAADRDARIAATGATAGGKKGNNSNGKTNNNKNGNGKANNGKGNGKGNTNSKPSGNGKGKGNGNNGKGDTGTNGENNDANGGAAGGKGAGSNGNGAANNGDPQKSLTLDPAAIQKNYANDGNANAAAGQEPSITSTNNFINFCLQFPDKPQTNGQQVIGGSCNQTPMGVIAAQSKMPAAKFQSPANGAKIPANKDFTISVKINNIELGHFTNPDTTFHMAPQQVNAQGLIKGHSHVTIQALQSLDQTTVVDATSFVFFKGLNDKTNNGVLSVTVPGGLPAGKYRLATINSSSNHQPALVAVAQRGALDDMVYFTVA